MLRWCLSTVRVLGSVDRTQGTRLLSSSAYAHESLSRFQTTNARGNSTSLAGTAHLQIVDDNTGKSSLGGNPTSDGQERSMFYSDTNTRAISALQGILTSSVILPDPSRRPTPNTIRSLYISAKARGQLSQLDSEMLSTLIGLFGSLSVDPSAKPVYTSSLLSRVRGSPVTRDYWPFVKEVVLFKEQRGMLLAHSDRYWVMRAELASLPTCKEGQRSDSPAFNRSLFRARYQYLRLSRHVFDPEVHVPYLTTLLSSTDPCHRRWAVDAVSSIIRTHPFLHAKVLKVLWDVVHDADATILGSLLAAISFRINRSPSRSGAAGFPIPAPVDATTLATSLLAFPLPISNTSTHGDAVTELWHEAFSSDVPMVQRQSNLLICCLLCNCDGNGIPISSLDLPSDPSVSMWKILFGLAILEKVSQAAGPVLLRDHALRGRVREMVRSLQDSWLHLVHRESPSTLISRAVTTSLFRLAGALADMKLFAACLESSKSLGFWNGDSLDPVEGPQLAAMAAMHLAASVQIYGCRAESVMKTLTDVPHQSTVLSAAVKELIHRNVELALMLYSIAVGSGSDIDVDTAYTLARALPPPHAAIFLRDERFSREQLGGILSSIGRGLKETRPQRHDTNLFVDIGNSLCKLYATSLPPSHFRGHLQLLLFELCAHGNGSQCTAVIASIVKFQPRFFRPSFLLRLIRLLLCRKQFRRALQIQKICVDARVECAFKLRSVVAARLRAPGSRRLSTNICLPRRKAGDHFWRAGTLFKSTKSSGPVLHRALQSLISGGRAHAAKVTFNRVASKVDMKTRTILGNTLLHGVLVRPLPRNGRRVRKFLGLLDSLVKCHEFAPDRITVNIVLKALMTWRSAFDHQRVRALFDHMVRGGYPAGTYSASHLPFGTLPLRVEGGSPLNLGLSGLPPYISFEKHAKPMYKMFINSFYLRNDVEAARVVVEILKIEQQKDALHREKRSAARSRGQTKVYSASGRDSCL